MERDPVQKAENQQKQLVLGLPKGSLQDATYALMKKAGFTVRAGARSYVPSVDDPELLPRLVRPQEISRYVEGGMLDAGITGHDWIVENGSDVVEVADLVYSKQEMRPVRWVLAVPQDSPIRAPKDLAGKHVATEAVGLTRRYLADQGVEAHVEYSWGATEVKPELGLVDAIVEITETGSSLRANNLRIVDTILESTTKLIANKAAWAEPWKRAKTEQLAILLQGALNAEGKVLLKMNAEQANVPAISDVLPALHAPTVNPLSSEGWVAIESVVDETVVREIIPQLKTAGAEGIIEIPLNKVVA